MTAKPDAAVRKPHLLTITADVEDDDGVPFYFDHQYSIACPYGPDEALLDCQTFVECEHQPPQEPPCDEPRLMQLDGKWVRDPDAPAEAVAAWEAYDRAEMEWGETHPQGSWEPAPRQCWAESWPELPDAAEGVLDAVGGKPGVYRVWVENAGWGVDDSVLKLVLAKEGEE